MQFQSAPGGEAGGNGPASSRVVFPPLFQSAPGGEAGGNGPASSRVVFPPLFQSAPGGEAGGNGPASSRVVFPPLFQSAPGGEAGGNLPDGDSRGQSLQGVSETLGRGHCFDPWSGRGVAARATVEGSILPN